MYYLVHSKSNIRGNVCQTYLMYVSIPMFFPDVKIEVVEMGVVRVVIPNIFPHRGVHPPVR